MSEGEVCGFVDVFDLRDMGRLVTDRPVEFGMRVDLAVVNGLVVDQVVLNVLPRYYAWLDGSCIELCDGCSTCSV